MADYFSQQTPLVSWNLSQFLIQDMSNIFQQVSHNSIEYNPARKFRCLHTIKLMAIQSFSQEERDKFKIIEKEILNKLCLLKDTINIKNPSIYNQANNYVYEKLEEYNILLMDVLNKYGYLIPPKKDRTKLIG